MRRPSILTRGLAFAFSSYGIALVLYGLARFAFDSPSRVVDVVSNFMPALLLPVLIALPCALLLRQWRTCLVLLPAFVGVLVVFGGIKADTAPPTSTPDPTTRFVVLTHNIAGKSNANVLVDNILTSQADVVLLQETNAYIERHLRPLIAAEYPYIAVHAYTDSGLDSRLGLGVLSKYPLIDEDYSAYADESSRQRFQIDVDGQRLTIYNVHLANPLISRAGWLTDQHSRDLDTLLTMLADEPAPLIVAGDFNMTDFSQGYERMSAAFGDAFGEAGSGAGLTYPATAPIPLVRIDYVFHSPDMRSLAADVLRDRGASDHYPLRVELAFDDQANAETPTPSTP